MKFVAVVAWREFVEHRMFLAAALAALAVTVVVPLIPSFLGWSPTEVREVLMWVMTLGFTWLSAVLLGASMVSGVVAAGRLGFFLARPVAGTTIWFGKLLGVLTLVWLGELLILIPSAALADLSTYRGYLGYDSWPAVAVVLGVPALLVLVAHGVATLWRAGTAWIALDFVALAVVGTVAWLAVSPLLGIGAEGAATALGWPLVAALMVALIVAGAVQIAGGRSDRRRHRQAFVSVLWPVLLVSVTAAAGYSQWLRSPKAGDLVFPEDLVVQPAGRWIVASGPAKGRFDVTGSFAFDLGRGTWFRLDLDSRWSSGSAAAFSPDGRAAVWPVRDGDGWKIRFGAVDELPRAAADSLVFLEQRPSMVLSPSGALMATIDDDTLVVTAVASGDLVGSVRLRDGWRVAGRYFFGEHLVRVLAEDHTAEAQSSLERGRSIPLRALEFDLATKRLVEAGVLADAGPVIAATLDEARDRLLLRMRRDNASVWQYVDARTLEAVEWQERFELEPLTEMLADGRLVRLMNEGDDSWLERLTADGEIDGRAKLPSKPVRAVIGFQPTASTVWLSACGLADWCWQGASWELVTVDLDAGRVREIDRGGYPIRWSYSLGTVTTPLPAGSPASRLYYGDAFSDEGPSLWHWNPQTGESKLVVGGRH